MGDLHMPFQLFILLSPFIFFIVTVGFLLKKGFDIISGYSAFWIIISLVLAIFYIYRLLQGETIDFLVTTTILSNILVIYHELKMREVKRSSPSRRR